MGLQFLPRSPAIVRAQEDGDVNGDVEFLPYYDTVTDMQKLHNAIGDALILPLILFVTASRFVLSQSPVAVSDYMICFGQGRDSCPLCGLCH